MISLSTVEILSHINFVKKSVSVFLSQRYREESRSMNIDSVITRGAQDWNRTSTSFRTPPPQDGASTNFATWAWASREE